VGHDVEQPAACRLGHGLEVAAPHPLGRLAAAPHVPLVAEVDGVVAQEVHRADDEVQLARLEQRAHPVLAPGDEVGLDAEAQVGLLAHEGAVVVEVVDRVLAPERVLPDLERGGEAVDVLGHPELGDAPLGRALAVALGVGGREEARGRVLGLVRAQVDVVVGQHPGGGLLHATPVKGAPRAATRRSAGRAAS
jgi:hypothetical protein